MARIIDAFTQFFDGSGNPLVNGHLRFLESGTNNTDKNTFADINETIANANPLQLDGEGRAPNVFGTGTYNVILFKDDIATPGTPGEQVQQFDPVGGGIEGAAFSDWNSSTIYSIGDIVRGTDGLDYRSITNNNQNNNPTASATNWERLSLGRIWNANVTYGVGDTALGSDGLLYTSKTASNLNNDPITSSANWGAAVNPDRLDGSIITGVILPRGYIDGLVTSNGTDTLHDIDVAVGSCVDSTNSVNINLQSVITKQIDANWAEGTNLGGFPSALTLTADTWYHFFVIAKTDGTVDAGWDTSLTATNLLADATGYTLFRRIASMLTDASADITQYRQFSDKFLIAPVSDLAVTNPGSGPITALVTAPPGFNSEWIGNVKLIDSTPVSAETFLLVSSLTVSSVSPTNLISTLATGTDTGGDQTRNQTDTSIVTNGSSLIRYNLNTSNVDISVRMTGYGWIDTRGKDV